MTFDEVMTELEDFVHWLSHQAERQFGEYSDMMNSDDIAGELFLELWKGFIHYQDKPAGELIALLKTMCDNRIGELKYRYFKTHRKVEASMVKITTLEPEDGAGLGELVIIKGKLVDAELISSETADDFMSDSVSDPAKISMSYQRVMEVRDALSQRSREMFDAIVTDNEEVKAEILLTVERKKFRFSSGGTIRLKRHHVSNALGMSDAESREAWEEIGEQVKEIMCD